MLREEKDKFLDDVTVKNWSAAWACALLPQDGAALVKALCNKRKETLWQNTSWPLWQAQCGQIHAVQQLTGKRLAMAEDTPGVTARDRLYGTCEWQDKKKASFWWTPAASSWAQTTACCAICASSSLPLTRRRLFYLSPTSARASPRRTGNRRHAAPGKPVLLV